MSGGEHPDETRDTTVTADLQARLAQHPADRYPAQHATTAFHLGTAHLQHGRAVEAIESLRAAHHLFGQLGMRLEQTKALVMMGVAFRDEGRVDLARESFERASDAFGELDSVPEQAAACFNLGLVLHAMGGAGAAQEAFTSAHDLFVKAGHLGQAGAASREHGASLLAAGEAGRAVPLLLEAAVLAERTSDLPGLGLAQNVLGLAYLTCGDPASAVDAFSLAVGAFPRSMRPSEHAMAKANLALAYEQLGNPPRARLAARQALMTRAQPPVRAQAQEILDRLQDGAGADIVTVLDAEPRDRWCAILREEALRWAEAETVERVQSVEHLIEACLGRPETSYDLAESLLGVLLELPPESYGSMVAAIVQATGGRPEVDGERVRSVFASAMARFPLPQWQRLAHSLNAAAANTGQLAGWR